MKLMSFTYQGNTSYGAIRDGKVIDLGVALGGHALDLKSLIKNNLLDVAAKVIAESTATISLDQVNFLPVIPNPGKIICVGLNYLEHVREGGRDVTESPALFLRTQESQTGHKEKIVLPHESSQLDYEGEIAIVIGKGGRRIKQEDAWLHIAGYSCYNDGSVRDWQMSTSQWTAGKNFWRTASFGPWMITADEIEPNQRMTLTTRLNGQEVQRATTDMMIHTIPEQIAYISTFMPLAPGDVIVTGTPGGVGYRRDPKVFIQHNDIVEVEVDLIGTLRNTVCREDAL